MAASKETDAKTFKCTMCLSVSNNLITLQCEHSFCQKCLFSSTKLQADVNAKWFSCTFCRKLTRTTDEDGFKKLGRMVNPNNTKKVLEEKMNPQFHITEPTQYSETTELHVCGACKKEVETTPATLWCSNCANVLCEQCTILEKKGLMSSTHLDEFLPHRSHWITVDKQVEQMCQDCRRPICQTCIPISHSKCTTIIRSDIDLVSVTSSLARGRLSLLEKIDGLRSVITKTKLTICKAKEAYQETESEIRLESQKAKDAVSLQEKTLLSNLKDNTDRQIISLDAVIKTKEISLRMNEQQSELIGMALKSEYKLDIYEMYQLCESKPGATVDGRDKDKGKELIDMLTFTSNPDRLAAALGKLQLGQIAVLYEGGLDLTATPVLQETFDFSLNTDECEGYPYDLTVLDVNGIDTLVVNDHGNCVVKSFYKRNNIQCNSTLKVRGNPWTLAKLKYNQVAITDLNFGQILIVDVKPELHLMQTITTKKRYCGITALTPSTLAVGSDCPPSVDILDMSGLVIRSLTTCISETVIKNPEYLTTAKNGNILISDHSREVLLCLTPQGDIVFNVSKIGHQKLLSREGIQVTDRKLRSPNGVIVTNTGDILLADFFEDVIHFTESGKFVRRVLKPYRGVLCPHGLYTDKHGLLYIGVSNHKEPAINVFSFEG